MSIVDDLNKLSINELSIRAKASNIKGYSRLNIQELIERIRVAENAVGPSRLTIPELVTLAEEKKIEGYNNLKIEQLIKLIQNVTNAAKEETLFSSLTVPQLKKLAKEKNIQGYSRLKKQELIQRIQNVALSTDKTTPGNAANILGSGDVGNDQQVTITIDQFIQNADKAVDGYLNTYTINLTYFAVTDYQMLFNNTVFMDRTFDVLSSNLRNMKGLKF
jgi:hypothetical protein